MKTMTPCPHCGTEVEVTPAMIRAGVLAYVSVDRDVTPWTEIVRAILEAALQTSADVPQGAPGDARGAGNAGVPE